MAVGLRTWLGLKRPYKTPPQTHISPDPAPERREPTPLRAAGASLHATATGRWWLPNVADPAVATEMRAGRIYDAEVANTAARFIMRGSIVLDVGSYVGQMTVMFARLVGPRGTVHAFEAEPFICELLRRNLTENEVENVVVHEGAVWDEQGKYLPFPEPDMVKLWSPASYGLYPRRTDARLVESLTIDSLRIDGPISFMKIDVQGSDVFVLRGARETVHRHQMPIIFEFEPDFQEAFGTSFSEYEAEINSLGYKLVAVINANNHLIVPKSTSQVVE